MSVRQIRVRTVQLVCELLVVVPVLVRMDSLEQIVKSMSVFLIHARTMVHVCELLVVVHVLVPLVSLDQTVNLATLQMSIIKNMVFIFIDYQQIVSTGILPNRHV